MLFVDVNRGRQEAEALAEKLAELARESGEAYVTDDDNGDNLSQGVREDLRGSFSYQRS